MFNMKRDKNKSKYSPYKMKKEYPSNKLVIGRLQEVISEFNNENYIPICKKTEERYIFEIVKDKDGKTKYRELFTGYVVNDKSDYFDTPYIVEMVSLEEELPDYSNTIIPYLNFLYILNVINTKNKYKKHNQK